MLTTFDIFNRSVEVQDRILIRSGFELARTKLTNDGSTYALGAGEALNLVLKPKNKFDSANSVVVNLANTDLHVGSSEYRKEFGTNTAGVLAELKSNANPSDDLPEALFSATWVWRNAGDTVQRPSATFDLVIINSAYDGVITTPEVPSGFHNPGYWTSIDDGSPTALNAIITVGGALPLMTVIFTAIGGVFNVWQLQTNTGLIASDGVNFQRPLDYNAVGNNVIWVRIA